MAGTSLADWLRTLDDETLSALLRARPDLATPPPADTTVLATRAGTRASLTRAAEELDAGTLAVLDALVPVVQRRAAEPAGARRAASNVYSANFDFAVL